MLWRKSRSAFIAHFYAKTPSVSQLLQYKTNKILLKDPVRIHIYSTTVLLSTLLKNISKNRFPSTCAEANEEFIRAKIHLAY